MNQLEPLDGRADVVFQPRIPRDELVDRRRLPLLEREHVRLDRLADALVLVALVRDDVKASGRESSMGFAISVPQRAAGRPFQRAFQALSPRAMMPRIDFRLRPNRSPIASNERLSAA